VSHGHSEGCLETSALQLNQAQYYQHYNIRDTKTWSYITVQTNTVAIMWFSPCRTRIWPCGYTHTGRN